MATTNFVDNETVIVAEWLNEVDALVHDVFNGATTDEEAYTNLNIPVITNTPSVIYASSDYLHAVQLTEANHPGVAQSLSNGAGAAYANSVVLPINGSSFAKTIYGGDGTTTYEAIIKTPSTLSDGTDRYILAVGLGDITTNGAATEHTYGVYFNYSDNVNSGKWQLVTKNTAGNTTADSGITVAAATWYKLKIEININWSSVTFSINETAVGTITANLPSGTTEAVLPQSRMMSTLGANDRISYIDYMMIKTILNTSR